MRLILTLSLLITTTNIFAQIVITDSNNKPIPFVQVISNNKYFFAQTNLRGELHWADNKKLNDTDTLFFHHVSYERAFKVKKGLAPRDTVRLQQRAYELREFSVTSKEQNNKYQIISACYRSYQANNDSMAYYTDGNVEYLSKVKKDNYDLLLKECRSFENTKLEEETPHRNVGISWKPQIPSPPFHFLPFQYAKKHNLKYIPLSIGKIEIFYRDSILIGEIEKSPEFIKYSINHIKSNTTRKAFKTEVNIRKFEVIMIFRNNGTADEALIKSFDDLLYVKTLREYKVKHNKDKDYTKIFNVDELFIEDVSYIQSLGHEEYKSSWGMPKKSEYKTEFWKTCNCEAYYPPFEQIFRGMFER